MNEHLRIANYLMLKSIELQDISLYHGKMGIVLALSLYAHQEGKKISTISLGIYFKMSIKVLTKRFLSVLSMDFLELVMVLPC